MSRSRHKLDAARPRAPLAGLIGPDRGVRVCAIGREPCACDLIPPDGRIGHRLSAHPREFPAGAHGGAARDEDFKPGLPV
ncbi:MAG: hypothetical protein ACE15B_01295 [Bryobacteraceae bacterium]